MKFLHALAISIALLVAAWVYLSIGMPELKFNPWIGFVAWAAYFAAGGGAGGFGKSLGAGIAAILLTAATMAGVQAAGGSIGALVLLVAILAFILVAMADIAALSYTPAAFLGAAAFFGAGGKPDITILFVSMTWLAGLVFGYLSEACAKKLSRPA